MKLRTDSFFIRFYAWFYAIPDEDLVRQKNFCPIFWKLMIAYTVAIPYAIISLPVILKELFDKNYEHGKDSTGARIGISFFIYFTLFVLFCMISSISLFFVSFTKDSFLWHCTVGGVLLWIVAFGVGVAELFKLIKRKIRNRRYKYNHSERIYEEKKPNIILTGIRAWYNKNCPRIEWINENENENNERN